MRELEHVQQDVAATERVGYGRTGLEMPNDLTLDEWTKLGETLQMMERAVMWWIGDWLAYGEGRGDWGETYSQALDATDYDYGTLRNASWVSESVELSRRRDNLSWSHHYEVASMPATGQDEWLDRADTNSWSQKQLRNEIKKSKVMAERREAVAEQESKAKLYNVPAATLIDSLEERSVDLLVTDPPYSTDVEDLSAFLDEWLYPALDLVTDAGRAFICTGNYAPEVGEYLQRLLAYERLELGNVLVWTYRNTLGPAPSHVFKNNWQAIFYLYGSEAGPLNTDQLTEKFSVLDITAPDGRHGNRYHAWQKPDELAERLIRLCSSPGHTVVDPFCGTGTFCIEAARMGRRAIGTDIDQDALAIAHDLGAEVVYAS